VSMVEMVINVNSDMCGMVITALIIQITVHQVVNGLVVLVKDLDNVEPDTTVKVIFVFLSLNNAHLHQFLTDQNAHQEVVVLKEHSFKVLTVCQSNHARMDSYGIQSISDAYALQAQ